MKKAIVVGASSGIGNHLAKLLVDNGYKVGITGRRIELLNNLQNAHQESIIVSSFNIDNIEENVAHLDQLAKELNGLDLLILSSGIGEINLNLDEKIEFQTTQTNVVGFTSIIDWSYNYFKQQGYGHLAAITSVAGLRGNYGAPAYSASKAYQINYLEGLRQKAKHDKLKIQITDIRPGFVKTAMAKGDGQFWVSNVEKASNQIFMALKYKKNVVYITKRWRIIAWILKLLPTWLHKEI